MPSLSLSLFLSISVSVSVSLSVDLSVSFSLCFSLPLLLFLPLSFSLFLSLSFTARFGSDVLGCRPPLSPHQRGSKASISVPLICRSAGQIPATCGTNPGTRKRLFAPTARAGGLVITGSVGSDVLLHPSALASEYGTYKTVKARVWLWLSGESP